MSARLLPIAAAALLVACGDDDGAGPGDGGGPTDAAAAIDAAPIDATVPPDFTCVATPPATAPDPLALGGLVVAEGQAGGVAVELRSRADGSLLAGATTDETGRFSLSVATGGEPVDATLVVAGDDAWPTVRFWGGPFAADTSSLGVALWTREQLDQAAQNARGTAQRADRGVLLLTARDCGGAFVSGAEVALSPAGGDLYYAGFQPPFCWPYQGIEATTPCGMVWVFDLPAGDYTARLRWNDDDVAAVPITVAAGTVSVASTDLPR